MSNKLQKLINHEASAREIGNIAEADAYKRKIGEMKKNVAVVRESQKVSGTWKCSCGISISLEIDAGEFGRQIAEMQFAPHRNNGHKLEKII